MPDHSGDVWPLADWGELSAFPLAIPTDEIDMNSFDDGPFESICFPKEVEPVILGALKPLADYRIWRGSYADIDNMARNFANLIDGLVDGCGCETANWAFSYSWVSGTLPLFAYRPETDGNIEALTSGRSLILGAENPDPANQAIGVRIFQTDVNTDSVGVHIDEIFVTTWGVFGVTAVEGNDCLGGFFSDGTGTSWRLTDTWPTGKDLVDFTITSTSQFFTVEIVGHGDWVCGVA